MSSNDKQVVENTRERWLSTDFNDNNSLVYANAADLAAAIVSGDLSSVPVERRGGVLAGGKVSSDGVTLTVQVSPIIGYKVGNPPGPFDSEYLKIQTVTITNIPLDAFVDAGNPRWVAIEVSPAQTAEVVSSRDIFQPALGTFVPQNVPKITGPDPVFTVNAGVPAPLPLLPQGNPDVVPLAYVYIPPAATFIEITDVILCRPLMLSGTNSQAFVGGGGVSATGSYNCQFEELSYTPPNRPTLSITQGLGDIAPTIINANTPNDPNFKQGEAFPGGTDVRIGVWFAAAPYPPGYDLDVSKNREFVDPSGRIPSVPQGTGEGYTQNGVFVFTSTSSPVSPSNLRLDLVGAPIPSIPTINDSTWNGGTIDRDSIVYVGSVANYTVGGDLYPQRVRTAGGCKGQVYISIPVIGEGQVDEVVFGNPPSENLVDGRSAQYFPPVPGSTKILPDSVYTIQCLVFFEVDRVGAVPGALGEVEILETGVAGAQFGRFYLERLEGTDDQRSAKVVDLYLDINGFVATRNQSLSAGTTTRLSFTLRSYIDSVLANR